MCGFTILGQSIDVIEKKTWLLTRSMNLLVHNRTRCIAWRSSDSETDVGGEPCFHFGKSTQTSMMASHDTARAKAFCQLHSDWLERKRNCHWLVYNRKTFCVTSYVNISNQRIVVSLSHRGGRQKRKKYCCELLSPAQLFYIANFPAALVPTFRQHWSQKSGLGCQLLLHVLGLVTDCLHPRILPTDPSQTNDIIWQIKIRLIRPLLNPLVLTVSRSVRWRETNCTDPATTRRGRCRTVVEHWTNRNWPKAVRLCQFMRR